MNNISKLTVKYNGKIVGYLVLENDKIFFQYDSDWIKNGFSISPLSLPLDDLIYSNPKDTFDGLYGVFFDSMPDGWGYLLLMRFLAKNGININKCSPLFILSLVNDSGLGGLSYEPSNTLKLSFDCDFDKLATEALNVLNDKYTDNLDSLYLYGGSSGGARPKAHVTINDEAWIVKFPNKNDDKYVGVKEYEANLLARKCGLNIPEVKLFESKIGPGYFGSKRFDRNKDGKRNHMISLSSLLETSHRIPNLDYYHLFQVISKISVDKVNDMYQAFRLMVFNVLFGNKDDHGKNFSFIYDEGKNGYILSPVYDITKTTNQIEHEMSINGSGNPTKEDLFEIAEHFSLDKNKYMKIYDEIEKNIKEYEKNGSI